MYRKKIGYIVVLVSFLCACNRYSEQDATRVCGVPVKGTPWELASTLASQREGGFVPECVEIYGDKAYIRGWLDTNGTNEPYRVAPYDDGLLPAEIVCDLDNGQVTHAGLYCEILDKEKYETD
jgi:hypothetical protein